MRTRLPGRLQSQAVLETGWSERWVHWLMKAVARSAADPLRTGPCHTEPVRVQQAAEMLAIDVFTRGQ
jgi:hypothetical protein